MIIKFPILLKLSIAFECVLREIWAKPLFAFDLGITDDD